MTTDENGHASTANDALPYGRYLVREKATNSSMLLTWREQLVTISENKKVYSVTAVDDVVRGGLAVEKRDSITGSTPQGDAGFEGITFEVINNSKNPVIVNDKSIAPGEVALTLTTDSQGKCSTANNALPFGEYILHEKSTNESMLNTAPDQTVIGHCVNDGDFPDRLGGMLTISGSRGADFGLGEGNRLPLILDVGMAGNFGVTLIQVLEHHNGFASQGGGVKGIAQFLGAALGPGNKLLLSRDLLAIYGQGLAGGLVHENARQLIGLARGQARVAHGVHYGDFGQRLADFLAVNGGGGADFHFTLIFVIDSSQLDNGAIPADENVGNRH